MKTKLSGWLTSLGVLLFWATAAVCIVDLFAYKEKGIAWMWPVWIIYVLGIACALCFFAGGVCAWLAKHSLNK